MMNIKSILLLALGLNLRVAFAQSSRCEILQALIKDSIARKAWLVDEYKGIPIVLIDVHGWFQECSLLIDSGREVKVVHDSALLKEKALSYITIKNFQINSVKYEIVCYQRNTNSLVTADLISRRRKMKIVRVKVGHF
jgi:hypothetical protein